jgi:DNA-binding GntR family transcriptional regulator
MISELREILEVAAAAAAVQRNHAALVGRMSGIYDGMRAAYDAGDTVGYRTLDAEFHQSIIDLCGNPYVSDAYNQVGFRIQALRSRLSDEAALNRLSIKDHRDMLKMIKAREIAALQNLMRAHINQTKQSYLDVLERRDVLNEEIASATAVA